MTQAMLTRYDGRTWSNLQPPALPMDSQASWAALNGVLYCAFRSGDDPNGNVVVQTFNGKNYVSTAWIAGGISSGTPALAAYAGALYCVYGNPSDGGLHMSQLTGAGWTKDATIYLTGTTKQPDGIWGSPALTVFQNKLYVLYQVYDHKGNLRCVTFDGANWVQVGGKGNNLPAQVPGMSMSPTAVVRGATLYILYQGYDGDGDKGNGNLTGATFDGGTNWGSLGVILTRCMSASPAAVMWTDGLARVFYQGFENNGVLTGMSTDFTNWTTIMSSQVKMISETGPGAAVVTMGSTTWLLVDALTQVPAPVYPASTTMTDTAAQALLNQFAPAVYLCSQEKYFPASVDWYLQKVTLNYEGEIELHQVTAQNLIVQSEGDDVSFLIPTGSGPSTGYIQAHDYKLAITDKQTRYGIQPPPPANPQAPFYGAVIDNPDKQATDLLYMFFYAYNGLAGYAFNEIGTHEGDWEHVIIRLSSDKTRVVGMYCQAHASDDAYSQWYYPPPYTPDPDLQFSWYAGSTTRPIVYAAAQSHASYVAAGEWPLGWLGWKGEDVTDNGPVWNAAVNVTLVSVPETNWLKFSGRWGKTDGWTATSPDAPAAQGWFAPRTDGPSGSAINDGRLAEGQPGR